MLTSLDIEIRVTPLHARTAAANRLNQWCAWNGYTYPAILSGLAAETGAARNAAGLADISPIAKYRIFGREAGACAARLLTRDAQRLAVGDAADTLWCDGQGFVRGLGRIVRLEGDEYWLLSDVADLPWLIDSAYGFDVEIADMSEDLAAIAVLGPRAALVLAAAGFEAVAALAAGAGGGVTLKGLEALALRRIGDPRFEIFAKPEDAALIWDWIAKAGASHGLLELGFQALELTRLEAGTPAPGADFTPAHLAQIDGAGVTPQALGLGGWVDMERGHFNGRRALRQPGAATPARVLRRIVIEGPGDAANSLLRLGPREAGHTVSALWSPRMNATVALAWVDADLAESEERLAVLSTIREGLRRVDRYLPARITL